METNVQSVATKRKAMVMDAVVFSAPPVSAYVSAQNIIDYYAECLEELSKGATRHHQIVQRALQCKAHMELLLNKYGSEMSEEVNAMMKDFLMEDETIRRRLVACNGTSQSIQSRDALFFEAKFYTIRYLSNVLRKELQELKSFR
jgi:predicted ribonuclease YlaK